MTSANNMLKFIWGKGQGPTAERVKIQKQLFGFSREGSHGFPNKPTCLAIDEELKLLGLSARSGKILVFGKPGVELEYELPDESVVTKLIFIPGQGRLLCVTSENKLHLLEIQDSKLELVKSHQLEGRLKSVSSLCVESARKRVLVGTEGGNIYLLRLWNMTMEHEVIFQDKVVKDVPENYKVNPGAVESILEHPQDSNKILIGFTRGLVVLWDKNTESAVHNFVAQQQLESMSWFGDNKFISSHNDGSYTIWDINTGTEEEPPATPYGPYPCKSIVKLYANERGDDSWKIFAGGMPRAGYGDKYSVTVMKNEDDHVVLDLSSKVIDFQVLESASDGSPDSLFILSEEELVAVDLKTAGWPVYDIPYLHSIHASAITCLIQATDIKPDLFEEIGKYKNFNIAHTNISQNEWPINGGEVPLAADSASCLVITGHEDGSVRFWGVVGSIMTPLSMLKTAKYFKTDDFDDSIDESRGEDDDEEDEDEWPPFRKVGTFDPYSDDPRLAVKKLHFCAEKKELVVGGTAGQVLVCTLDEAKESTTLKICKAEIVTEKEGFTWKGHQPLVAKTSSLNFDAGWQPKMVLQISPPASITALAYSKQWGVMGAGTAHGFVLVDSNFFHVITARSTLNAQDIANADDNPMSRRKSLKKSLRESFRRLRKGRSQRNTDKKKPTSQTNNTTSNTISRTIREESPDVRPVERQIEARSVTGSEDGLSSMVRCLHFAETYIAGPASTSPTLWAGTNSGQVLVFLLTITPEDKRKNDKITAVLAKEIQLKHRAPVIDIVVYDAVGLPVKDSRKDSSAPHRVLIASEEQFKVFLLPNLKPSGKYKLTAQEGARVRKIKSVTFTGADNSNLVENCIVFLTNLGEISILVFPELRRQVTTSAIKKEDVVGISSMALSDSGDGVYMSSSSELQVLTVAAKRAGFSCVGKSKVHVPPENRAWSEESDTDRQADEQNRQNEREAEQNGLQARASPRSVGGTGEDGPDSHNETNISEASVASGDITLDSVRDHIISQGIETSVSETVIGNRTERVETVSRTIETVSVTHQQFLPPAAPAPIATAVSRQQTATTATTTNNTAALSTTSTTEENATNSYSSTIISSQSNAGTTMGSSSACNGSGGGGSGSGGGGGGSADNDD